MSNVIEELRRAVLAGGQTELTDGQLLEHFLRNRDQAAAAALVRRHGPLVWGVCRRVLAHEQDAEDAFQATFVVFLRKAESIRPRAQVANWLYGVAHRTALKARATMARRHCREKQLNPMPEPPAGTPADPWHELLPLLDQELVRLPDKYRMAVLLCDLEGKTRREAARQLNIPEGTLSSRLTSARALLAKRLARHGLSLSGGIVAALMSRKASAEVPRAVTASTIRLMAAGAVPARVAALASEVLKMMLLSRLKTIIALMGILGLVLLGAVACSVAAWPALPTSANQPPNQADTAPGRNASSGAHYCWLVFDPRGKARVLVRLRGEQLALDRNGDGKFDRRGERFRSVQDCKDVAITDRASKMTYVITQVAEMHVVPPEKFLDIRIHVKGRPYALWSEVMLAPEPKHAPELHFGGPFTITPTGMRIVNRAHYLLENSLVKLDFLVPQVIARLAGKELVQDSTLPSSLQRGKPNPIFAFITARGDNSDVAVGSPDVLEGNTPPFSKGVQPLVEVEFPAPRPTLPPIKKRFPMHFTRGCFFRVEIVVPREAGEGKARMTFSFDAWKGVKVRPTTAEIPVEPR